MPQLTPEQIKEYRKSVRKRWISGEEVLRILNEKYDKVARGYPNYPKHFNKDNPRLKLIEEIKREIERGLEL